VRELLFVGDAAFNSHSEIGLQPLMEQMDLIIDACEVFSLVIRNKNCCNAPADVHQHAQTDITVSGRGSKKVDNFCFLCSLCSATALWERKLAYSRIGKAATNLGLVPEPGAVHILHFAPKSNISKVCIFTAAKLARLTCSKKENVAVFTCDTSTAFTTSHGGTRSEMRSCCSATAVAPSLSENKALTLAWSCLPSFQVPLKFAMVNWSQVLKVLADPSVS